VALSSELVGIQLPLMAADYLVAIGTFNVFFTLAAVHDEFRSHYLSPIIWNLDGPSLATILWNGGQRATVKA
jgi:hypothetical protein